VWTDGACTSSGVCQGFGGWAYIIIADNAEMESADGMVNTTNNRMEIEAVLRALKQIKETKHILNDKQIMFYCDSALVIETLRKGATFKQKKNLDKWQAVNKLMSELSDLGFDIDFIYVKAHDKTNPSFESQMNCRVDSLATKARDRIKEIAIWL
jgi:ribonuclease HI